MRTTTFGTGRTTILGALFPAALFLALAAIACVDRPGPAPRDEALAAGRSAESFPAAGEDYFHDMDGGIALSPAEVQGRNMWLVWTGGNDRLWDVLAARSFGTLDLLKTLSSHPSLKAKRDNRWEYLGLVNEPCFTQATGPDPDRFGLWLDRRDPGCPPDPFESEAAYPGVKTGARGRNLPLGSYYGQASGIVGLRLFPNPAFDAAAARRWNAEEYYTNEKYYDSKELIRPYRVGMSCAFCHVGPSPTRPPLDPAHPAWANLASNVGAQYFWIDRIFSWQADPAQFPFQVFHTSRPGSLDTSLVSSDNINNPRTMNAVYGLWPRLVQAQRFGRETLAGGGLLNRQFNEFVKDGPLTQFFTAPDTVFSPRVLKDASDSVGALGALNRVYLNIGLYSEEWLRHFNPLVGGKPITPITIATARESSSYWKATEAQTPAMALFFLKSTSPHRLADAPGGAAFLTTDHARLERGKVVFAERCARCHSSKLPPSAPGLDPGGCAGPNYLDCFGRYWSWTRTDDFKAAMRRIVLADDFLEDNYLSAEFRVPVTLLRTNACSPLATNAIAGNIWDNFSSATYKSLPSVGSITWYHPVTGEARPFAMPAGGRGYTRPASLISLWSTAPFLLNNSLGRFESSPSVEARMRSFDDSIEKLLWPAKRERDEVLGDRIPGAIDRTTASSRISVPAGFLPDALRPFLGLFERIAPWLVGEGGLTIGPIPKGTPVNLLANLDLLGPSDRPDDRLKHQKRLLKILLQAKKALKALPTNATDEEARRAFEPLVDPLLEMSKCPDMVVNRGHYFGTEMMADEPGLSDAEKRDLIEFLKTL